MRIPRFQAEVMHLTDDVTKLKLFMDVLDGTKAAVRFHSVTHLYYWVAFCSAFEVLFFFIS